LRERPRTRDALAALSGIGERKLARYGDAFLRALAAHAPA
jgi:ATP-dependent DNA helicase RecQ